VGDVGYRDERTLSAVGETVDIAARLVDAAPTPAAVTVSDVVAREAGLDSRTLASHTLGVAGRAAPLVVHPLPAA
jgi:adenylate cyclase